MKYIVDIQNDSDFKNIPNDERFQLWVDTVLNEKNLGNAEVTIRIVDEDDSATLNEKYRNKKGATNVLSFPANIPKEIDLDHRLLGDLIVCAPIVEKEAIKDDIQLEAHWAHMIIHGILHLLGLEHDSETQAVEMESTEIALLEKLGYTNPYLMESK